MSETVPGESEISVDREQLALSEFASWAGGVRPLWTPLFLGLCVLLTLVSELSGGSTDTYAMYRMGALWRPAVLEGGQWWRLATATVLHFGWLHLLVNLYSLYAVGGVLERILGRSLYLLVLIGSGLGGSLCSLWGNPQSLSAGLSGALFGLAASTCVLIYTKRLPLPQTAQRSLAGGLLPAIAYNLIAGMTASGIDNYAHIGGLVAGALCTLLAYPRRSEALRRPVTPTPFHALPLIYVAALAIGALNYARHPLPMSQPHQVYELGGTRLSFGREFRYFSSEGVIRVYVLPGCVLFFGVVPKQSWPGPEAFVQALKREQSDTKVSELQVAGHACVVSRGKQGDKPMVSCRILDVGSDVVEVGMVGQFVDGRRDNQLLAAIVGSIEGAPSKWGR